MKKDLSRAYQYHWFLAGEDTLPVPHTIRQHSGASASHASHRVQYQDDQPRSSWEVLAVHDARLATASFVRRRIEHVVCVLVLGLLERRRRLFLDALGYGAWGVCVSWPSHKYCQTVETNLGRCTCPSRGCFRRSPEAGGSSLLPPLWGYVRSIRSARTYYPLRNHHCRTPAGTRFRFRPNPGENAGALRGSTTGRLPSNRR
jgi:hypothetical protein